MKLSSFFSFGVQYLLFVFVFCGLVGLFWFFLEGVGGMVGSVFWLFVSYFWQDNST